MSTVSLGSCPSSPAATTTATASTASSSTSSSPPPQVAETPADARVERLRAKARIKARRTYQRKLARLEQLRNEVEQLERQRDRLDAQQGQGHASEDSSVDHLALVAGTTIPPVAFKTREEAEERLRVLWEQGARLRQENNKLCLRFVAMSGVAARLGELLSEEHKPYIAVASHLLFLRPLTPPECLAIHQRSMAVVRAFTSSTMLSAPLLRQVAGWHERREVDRGLFRYALQKRFFRCGSAATLATKSFLLLTEPAQMRRFYSDALNVDVRLVQKVDDNNCVLFQQMRAMDTDCERSVSKSLLLVSRFKIANGFRIHIYGLEEDELPVADHHAREENYASSTPVSWEAAMNSSSEGSPVVVEVWNSQFCWIQFEDVAVDDAKTEAKKKKKKKQRFYAGKTENACLMTYAGITPTIGANARFWMSEVLLHCLRWKHLMVGPWVTLPMSE